MQTRPTRTGITPSPYTQPRTSRMIQESCPICGGASSGVVGIKDALRVLRCASCTLQYSERAPEVGQLPDMYNRAYFHGSPAGYPAYEADESLHRARARGYLQDLMAYTTGTGTLLDVGCATGFFLDEARQAGWRVRGCEVSEWAATYARSRFELDVIQAPFPTPLLGPQRYDAVTFLNVFEQLPDPHAAERVLRDLVAPSGLARTRDLGRERPGRAALGDAVAQVPAAGNTDLPQPPIADDAVRAGALDTGGVPRAHQVDHACAWTACPRAGGASHEERRTTAPRDARQDRAAFAALSPGRPGVGCATASGPERVRT